jgi:ankyrin repeat protein
MEGNQLGEDRGIIPRSAAEVFQYIQADIGDKSSQWLVRCSYAQIYNEKISDLLDAKGTDLKIRESGDGGTYIERLTERVVKGPKDVYQLLIEGRAGRNTDSTKMNATSSRSHAVFTMVVEHSQEDPTIPDKTNVTVGKLHLVDLAGSERLDVTSGEAKHQKETVNINTSLTAFGKVVLALTSKGGGHIPYRDSKLTRILQDSMGGNSKTTMIGAIGPMSSAYLEAVTTLKFCNRAKQIKNAAVVNKDTSESAMLTAMQAEIGRLMQELAAKQEVREAAPAPLVDLDEYVQLLESSERSKADNELFAAELEERRREVQVAAREKEQQMMKIRELEGQLVAGGTEVEDTDEFKAAVAKERQKLEFEAVSKQSEIEMERLRLEKEKAEFEEERTRFRRESAAAVSLPVPVGPGGLGSGPPSPRPPAHLLGPGRGGGRRPPSAPGRGMGPGRGRGGPPSMAGRGRGGPPPGWQGRGRGGPPPQQYGQTPGQFAPPRPPGAVDQSGPPLGVRRASSTSQLGSMQQPSTPPQQPPPQQHQHQQPPQQHQQQQSPQQPPQQQHGGQGGAQPVPPTSPGGWGGGPPRLQRRTSGGEQAGFQRSISDSGGAAARGGGGRNSGGGGGNSSGEDSDTAQPFPQQQSGGRGWVNPGDGGRDSDEDEVDSGVDRMADARQPRGQTDHEAALEQYSAALQDPRSGIPLGNRRLRLTTYKMCFSGADAAGWFMANMKGIHSATQAQAVGQQLLDLGVICHVKAAHMFVVSDSELFQFRGQKAADQASVPEARLTRAGSASSISSRSSLSSLAGAMSRAKSWAGSNSSLASMQSSASSSSRSSYGGQEEFDATFDDDGAKSPLHVAAGKGDIGAMRQLVADFGVENMDSSGRTPLMYSVIGNRGKACKLLVKFGADINARDDQGNTPLIWACCRGTRDSLKELLKMGAEVASIDNEGRTAIHWATKLKRMDCLELLLRCAYRVVVNKKDEEQLTALHWAVMCDNAGHAHALIKSQADPTVGDGEGRTPLHYAVSRGAMSCMHLLLEQARMVANQPDTLGRTPLHAACNEGSDEVIALLISTPGIDVNAADQRLTTPLHWAAVVNRPDVCSALLKAGARLMARDAAGLSPLHYATERGHLDCANIMQRFGGESASSRPVLGAGISHPTQLQGGR